ncbi:hypothetical protein CDS [Bradyrhizobium sp.]|nr:hypothetical protein CDS [Bradyrhizobium sp.]
MPDGPAALFLHQGLAPPPGGCDLILPLLKASRAGIKPLFRRGEVRFDAPAS